MVTTWSLLLNGEGGWWLGCDKSLELAEMTLHRLLSLHHVPDAVGQTLGRNNSGNGWSLLLHVAPVSPTLAGRLAKWSGKMVHVAPFVGWRNRGKSAFSTLPDKIANWDLRGTHWDFTSVNPLKHLKHPNRREKTHIPMDELLWLTRFSAIACAVVALSGSS